MINDKCYHKLKTKISLWNINVLTLTKLHESQKLSSARQWSWKTYPFAVCYRNFPPFFPFSYFNIEQRNEPWWPHKLQWSIARWLRTVTALLASSNLNSSALVWTADNKLYFWLQLAQRANESNESFLLAFSQMMAIFCSFWINFLSIYICWDPLSWFWSCQSWLDWLSKGGLRPNFIRWANENICSPSMSISKYFLLKIYFNPTESYKPNHLL